MQKFKRLLASFIMLVTILGIGPVVAAHAEWRQSGNGWWYAQENSYSTGWTQIDGKWYYFDSNGYMKTGWINDSGNWFYTYGDGTMAHDTTIDGCYLNSSGAWTTSIPATGTTSYNDNSGADSYSGGTQYVDANGNGLIKGSVDYIYHVPGSTYYNKTKNVQQWFKTVEEAEAAGYRAPKR